MSNTLLARHTQFEGCPTLKVEQSRARFRHLIDRILSYVPLEQCFILLEKTGHYHKALENYLLELDLSVFVMPVQERAAGLMKSDKRDALGLANHLYNQLEKGIQGGNKLQLVRRALPPTEAAALLQSWGRHRYELIHESTQRKNKLTVICDELFLEFTQVCKNPNALTALRLRHHCPTPQAVATADLDALCRVRRGGYPTVAQLLQLQALASQSIGTNDRGRQRGLVIEQTQLIKELELMQTHVTELDHEIRLVVAGSREGRILTSIPGIGPIQAATLIAAIGHIDNFPTAAALKSYLGWAPRVRQTGTTLDQATLSRRGTRPTKQMLFLIVGNALQMDCAWASMYRRLIPIKCTYDERRRDYRGKKKVIGRIAGQIVSMIYALLKQDQERLSKTPPGTPPPEPILYDPTIHNAHREGHYRPLKSRHAPATIMQLPKR